MSPLDAAEATAQGFSRIATHFMFAPETYARGADLGLEGLDFYFIGRGGTLGRVDAALVAAAFGVFEPGTVREAWERALAVADPMVAAVAWSEAAHAWGEEHLPADVDLARLAELVGKVVDGADGVGAPTFVGWRLLPRPSAPAALAMHHLNALRELRGAMHLAALLAAGLSPLEAVLVKTPFMAAMFGWPEPYPEPGEDIEERWQEAEDGTNRAMARVLLPLTEAERDELTDLVRAVQAALPG
jgi:hypothetical protein